MKISSPMFGLKAQYRLLGSQDIPGQDRREYVFHANRRELECRNNLTPDYLDRQDQLVMHVDKGAFPEKFWLRSKTRGMIPIVGPHIRNRQGLSAAWDVITELPEPEAQNLMIGLAAATLKSTPRKSYNTALDIVNNRLNGE